MADSTYASQPKSQWRIMLKRKLSKKLQDALVMANDVPTDYHHFVSYLRQKDAAFQEISAYHLTASVPRPVFSSPPLSSTSRAHINYEPTVSQGGSAMDLDVISRQKGEDGRLTLQAKDARRTLGRCLWCNKQGHAAINCPLGVRSLAGATLSEISSSTDELKGQLQQ